VGLTVLAALCMLAAMIVVFTGIPEMFHPGYRIRILFDGTHNAKTGDPVRLAGVRIGSITDISFTDDDPRKGVTFTVLIDRGVRIPADVTPRIHSEGFLGSAYVEMAYNYDPMGGPDARPAMGFLPTDRIVTIPGDTTAKGGILPAEIADALADMRKGFSELALLAENLNRFVAPPPASGPASRQVPAQSLAQVLITVAKVGRTLDELNKVIGDKENQANFKAALGRLTKAGADASEAMASMKSFAEEARQSLRQTTKSATDVGANIDSLTKRLVDNAEKVSVLMATMNKTLTKMESGKGSLGRLANDPRLYNNLTEAAEQLSKLVSEMRQLVKKWQSQGVGVKVKSL